MGGGGGRFHLSLNAQLISTVSFLASSRVKMRPPQNIPQPDRAIRKRLKYLHE